MRSNGRLVAVVVGTVLTVSAAVLGGAGAFSTVPAGLVTLSLATVTMIVFGRGDGRGRERAKIGGCKHEQAEQREESFHGGRL